MPFIKKLHGIYGFMKIVHNSHVRIPSSRYGKLNQSAFTFYNRVQTSADIVNHWSKQLLDNIHYTHSRYIVISIKQQEALETFKKILLFVSWISVAHTESIIKLGDFVRDVEDPKAKKTGRKTMHWFNRFNREQHIFKKKKSLSAKGNLQVWRHQEAK